MNKSTCTIVLVRGPVKGLICVRNILAWLLTLLLTLNDINKPINKFITPNIIKKWRYLSSYVKRVKVLFW